jgi:hypothetical protein
MRKARPAEQSERGDLYIGEAVPKTERVPRELLAVWRRQEEALRAVKATSQPDMVVQTPDAKLLVVEAKTSLRVGRKSRSASRRKAAAKRR